jgi:hypothetical protein
MHSSYQYELDKYDVRNKIKQSLAVQNRQTEEREKLEILKQQEKEKDKKVKYKPTKIDDVEDEIF